MIEQFFRPDSVEQALELKRRYGMKPSGSPGAANSMLHQPVPIKRLPFPYRIWNWTGLTGITVHCGLAQCLACSHCVMRDLFLQRCVKPSVLFTHAMFVISRPLVVKSPPAGEESVLLPVLLALDAELVFGNGETLSIEDYGLPMRSPANRNYH